MLFPQFSISSLFLLNSLLLLLGFIHLSLPPQLHVSAMPAIRRQQICWYFASQFGGRKLSVFEVDVESVVVVNAFSPHALHFGIYFFAMLLLDVLEIFVFATPLGVVVRTSH